MNELDISSYYCLRIKDLRLVVELNILLPNVADFVNNKTWECEDIFNFAIRFDRIIEDE